MNKLGIVLASALALGLAGCGSSSGGNANSGGSGGSGNTGGSAGSANAGGSAGASQGGGAGAGGSAGDTMVCPKLAHKTLVVVGDSISDTGGNGGDQQPFYRTLLVQNDDTLYPAWKGLDLHTCWGLDPNANVVKVSVGGAIATENPSSGASILLDQVKSLPASLPGPVLVVGTIGGNDVLAGFVDYLTGNQQAQQSDLNAFLKGWDDAMDELTRANRFGQGVRVDVLMTNIYDPSGGTGDFTYTPESKACPGEFALWPQNKSTTPALQPWNDALVQEAAKYPNVYLMDLHGEFLTHQVDTPDPQNWFHDDCIHPNSIGQEKIRELFWGGIVALH
jgi:lysophospholipase L1-like esterase